MSPRARTLRLLLALLVLLALFMAPFWTSDEAATTDSMVSSERGD